MEAFNSIVNWLTCRLAALFKTGAPFAENSIELRNLKLVNALSVVQFGAMLVISAYYLLSLSIPNIATGLFLLSFVSFLGPILNKIGNLYLSPSVSISINQLVVLLISATFSNYHLDLLQCANLLLALYFFGSKSRSLLLLHNKVGLGFWVLSLVLAEIWTGKSAAIQQNSIIYISTSLVIMICFEIMIFQWIKKTDELNEVRIKIKASEDNIQNKDSITKSSIHEIRILELLNKIKAYSDSTKNPISLNLEISENLNLYDTLAIEPNQFLNSIIIPIFDNVVFSSKCISEISLCVEPREHHQLAWNIKVRGEGISIEDQQLLQKIMKDENIYDFSELLPIAGSLKDATKYMRTIGGKIKFDSSEESGTTVSIYTPFTRGSHIRIKNSAA